MFEKQGIDMNKLYMLIIIQIKHCEHVTNTPMLFLYISAIGKVAFVPSVPVCINSLKC